MAVSIVISLLRGGACYAKPMHESRGGCTAERQEKCLTSQAPTVGYRITENGASLACLPDHEPALGVDHCPGEPDWTSGFELAAGADLLIHDAQFTAAEYLTPVGWGHSAIPDTIAFAVKAGVEQLVPFHHDPAHADRLLDLLFEGICQASKLPFKVIPAMEGTVFEIGKTRSS
jgi:hypothetical protein